MSKAGQRRKDDFNSKVADVLIAAGASVKRSEHTHEFLLDTPRIGPITFTLFTRGDDLRKRDEIYSIYARLPLDHTKEQVTKAANIVNATFIDKMNPSSGKWNIHSSTAEGALLELTAHRLQWLMQ